MDDSDGPYREAAKMYYAAGWRGILPLPPNSKKLTLKSFTGHEGVEPSYADIQAWMDGAEGGGNIALRVPDGVLGIDVDAYNDKVGAETLGAKLQELGPLPPTWLSSARGGWDGEPYPSGIQWYRVPTGLSWPGQLGEHVELIQRSHRYAVVWPSVHPETKTKYRWYMPSGQVADFAVPTPAELAELPQAWVDALSLGEYQPDAKLALASIEQATPLLVAWYHPGTCRMTAQASAQAALRLSERTATRHDELNQALLSLVRYGSQGHRGLAAALADLRAAWMREVTDATRPGVRSPAEAEGEWTRSLTGAVATVGADATPSEPCSCSLDLASLIPPPEIDDGRPRQSSTSQNPPKTTSDLHVDKSGQSGQNEIRPHLTLAQREIDRVDLADLKPPEPLIERTLDRGTVTLLAGYTGTAKSFVALDWAACVATGELWFGRGVERGTVVYVAGEGVAGINARLVAWERHRNVNIERGHLKVLPFPLNLGKSGEVAELCDYVRELGATFVVFDTLNRCSVGLDENSARDMGIVVDAMYRVVRSTDNGTCLLIHHDGKDKTTTRGNSAIEAGMDTVYKTSFDEGSYSLQRQKRKDGPLIDRVDMKLLPIGSSVVLDLAQVEWTGRPNEQVLLSALINTFQGQGASRADLRNITGMAPASFHRAMGDLLKSGSVVNKGTDQRPYYYVAPHLNTEM